MTKERGKKVIILGQGAIGKTCLAMRLSGLAFPEEYIPTVLDDYSVTLGSQVLDVVDAGGRGMSENTQLRALNYPNTRLALLCFSMTNKSSLDDIKVNFYPHLMQHASDVSVMLVALKSDLKTDEKFKDRVIDIQEIYKYMDSIKSCVGFVETSSLTGDGLEDLTKICKSTFVKAKNKTKVPKATVLDFAWNR